MDRWAERCVQLAAIGCWVAGSVGHLPLAICDWQDIVNATHQLPRPIDQNSMRLLGQFSLGWSVKSYVKRFHMNMSTCLFAGGAAMPIRTFWQQSFLFSRYIFFFKRTFQLHLKWTLSEVWETRKSAQSWMRRPYYVELSYYYIL